MESTLSSFFSPFTPLSPFASPSLSPDADSVSNFVVACLRNAAILFFVWIAGRLRFSFVVVVVVFFCFVVREKQKRKTRIFSQLQSKTLAVGEERALNSFLEATPFWLSFGETAKAEWLNKCVKQLWPFLDDCIHKIVQDHVEPIVKSVVVDVGFQDLSFDKVNLGNAAPRIAGIKVLDSYLQAHEVLAFDVEIVYDGDARIEARTTRSRIPFKLGLKDFKLHGTLRCEIRSPPPVQQQLRQPQQQQQQQRRVIDGLTVSFLYNPVVEFELTHASEFLELPMLKSRLRSHISDLVAGFMVLPNRVAIPFHAGADATLLRHPAPVGVVRVVMAQIGVAVARFARRKSLMVTTKVGAQSASVKIGDNNDAEIWSEVQEFVIDEAGGQLLEIAVSAKDANADTKLASYDLELESLKRRSALEDFVAVAGGCLHLRLTWFHLVVDAKPSRRQRLPRLDRFVDENTVPRSVVMRICKSVSVEERCSEGFLLIHLYSAELDERSSSSSSSSPQESPVSSSSSSSKPPSPRVVLRLHEGREVVGVKSSSVKPDTRLPVWEEAFSFLVGGVDDVFVEVVVVDGATDGDAPCDAGGAVVYHLRQLMAKEALVDFGDFELKGELAGKIKMRFQFRFLLQMHCSD